MGREALLELLHKNGNGAKDTIKRLQQHIEGIASLPGLSIVYFDGESKMRRGSSPLVIFITVERSPAVSGVSVAL